MPWLIRFALDDSEGHRPDTDLCEQSEHAVCTAGAVCTTGGIGGGGVYYEPWIP